MSRREAVRENRCDMIITRRMVIADRAYCLRTTSRDLAYSVRETTSSSVDSSFFCLAIVARRFLGEESNVRVIGRFGGLLGEEGRTTARISRVGQAQVLFPAR